MWLNLFYNWILPIWGGFYLGNVYERYIRITNEKTAEIIYNGFWRVWFERVYDSVFFALFYEIGRFMLSPIIFALESTPYEYPLEIIKVKCDKFTLYIAGKTIYEKITLSNDKAPILMDMSVEDKIKDLQRQEIFSSLRKSARQALNYIHDHFDLVEARYTIKEMERFVPKNYLLQYRKQTKDILLALEHGEFLLNEYKWSKIGLFHLISHAFGSKSQQLWYQIQKEDSEELTYD